MRKRRGLLLLEGLIAFGLIFTASMVLLSLLQSMDKSYAQAAQVQVALRLARENLELVRAGSLAKTTGSRTLSTVTMQLGAGTVTFTPTLQIATSGKVLLVTSQVGWSEARRTHGVELQTYVAP